MEVDQIVISQEILRRLGIPFKPEKSKQMVSCWEHGPERTPSLSIDLEKGVFHCFGCGASGTLKNKYYQTFGRSILRDLGLSKNQIDLLQQTYFEQSSDFSKIPHADICIEGKGYPISITEAGKKWLKFRGFSENDFKNVRANYYQFGICKKNSDKSNKKEWTYVINRVVIPIYEKGMILSYELRDIMGTTFYEKQLKKRGLLLSDHPYKKLLYPKNSSQNTLFELDKLKKDEPLYIVEGLMDLISLRTHNSFKNSTCLFHCIPSERQYYLLNDFKKIVYIINNDLPGAMGCKKLMERNKNTSFLCVPSTVNDVNDILQRKDKRFSSVNDLIEKYDWLSNIKSSMRDIDSKIKLFSEQEKK
jgi:DNA primase